MAVALLKDVVQNKRSYQIRKSGRRAPAFTKLSEKMAAVLSGWLSRWAQKVDAQVYIPPVLSAVMINSVGRTGAYRGLLDNRYRIFNNGKQIIKPIVSIIPNDERGIDRR